MRVVTGGTVAFSLGPGLAAAAGAQGEESRPATTTWEDTGLWFVPVNQYPPTVHESWTAQPSV